MKTITATIIILSCIFAPMAAFAADSVYDDAVSYWTFDTSDVSSGTLADKGSAGNTGVITGAATGANGIVNQAFTFDGNSDYVTDATPSGLPVGANARTISLWVKTSATTNFAYLAGWATPNTNQEYAIALRDGNRLHINGWNAQVLTNYYLPADGSWHNIVATFNGTLNTIYVDGSSVFSQNQTWNTGISAGVAIGQRPAGGSYFTGSIDDIGIWSDVLTQDEITILYKTRYVASGIADIGGLDYSAAVLNQLSYMYGTASGTPLTIDDVTWSYVSGLLPGDDGSRALGEGWTYGGNYYIKLGSGLKGETGGGTPEPATIVMLLAGGVMGALKVVRKRLNNNSYREIASSA